MRIKFLLSLLFFIPLFFTAQTQNPVSWTASYNEISEIEAELSITASVNPGWHIYSQRPTDSGPIPTSFTFTPLNNFELVGKTSEENAVEEYVKAFEAKVFVFTGKAVFKQKIKRLNSNKINTLITLEYMTCNDMMCLPPKTIELSVIIPAAIKK